MTPIAITRKGTAMEVSATIVLPVSSAPLRVRLDIALSVTAGGKTASVLAFQQLFEIDQSGSLSAAGYAFDNAPLVASATGPSRTVARRRQFIGCHPLISIGPTAKVLTISINAEFVDITDLWWLLRNDQRGWYCHPELGGRQTNLRVLGWTSGADPMIWFAIIPDAAASASVLASNEDVILFRPQGGANSFVYRADETGLTDAKHDKTSMYMLARYLLSPIPASKFPALKAGGTVVDIDNLADQLQPLGGTPADPDPPDPMDFAYGTPAVFRPVGLENAFNASGGERVLLCPLGAGDGATPYEGLAQRSGVAGTVRSALTTLWTSGAIARNRHWASPDFGGRELWLAGHSGGNVSMWSCAQNNKEDVARLITHDAATFDTNLTEGIRIMPIAAAARKALGKTLEVFAIVTPHLSHGKNTKGAPATLPFLGLDDDTDDQLRRTGAVITVLPEFADRESYWNPAPATPANGFVRYLLANWPEPLLVKSAGNPDQRHWRYCFFHEMAIFGGALVPPPPGAPTGSSPTVKTFFEQALGSPNPRPPPGKP